MSSAQGMSGRSIRRRAVIAAALTLPSAGLSAAAPQGRVFRFAFQSDAAGLDPLFIDEAFTTQFLMNVYEGLTRWSDAMDAVPALATSWEAASPTTWVFRLRSGVTFHDGTPFTADDAVFSFARYAHPDSIFRTKISAIVKVEALDPLTLRVSTSEPVPILPRMLVTVPMMSRAWASAMGAGRPSNSITGARGPAMDHANGTGPFKIAERIADEHTRLVPHDGWWDTPSHNLTEAVFVPIKSAATRVAALTAGQVDMIWPVPLPDIPRLQSAPGITVDATPSEWTIMFRLNLGDDELRTGNVRGRNPFRDPRVREALFRAIDIDAINRAVMRGLARPINEPIAPTINGFDPALDHRPPFDPQASRRLLAEAGYPEGFAFAVHVPNNRYINDEAIGAAITAMFARVGLDTKLVSQSRVRHFTQAGNGETDMYMTGFASATLKDGYEALSLNFYTRGDVAGGSNYGRYSNPAIDRLTDRLRVEADPTARRHIMSEAFAILQRDWAFLPLHVQPSVWAVRGGTTALHLPDDAVRLWRVRMA